MNEKLIKRIKTISKEFSSRGFELEEDLMELAQLNPEIADRLENTKYKKISFFVARETNSIGITLEDVQIEFFVEEGEDEIGPWYEATAEIRYF